MKVQIWVSDTRQPDFKEKCRRQSLLAAQTDMTDTGMLHFKNETLADLDDWTE